MWDYRKMVSVILAMLLLLFITLAGCVEIEVKNIEEENNTEKIQKVGNNENFENMEKNQKIENNENKFENIEKNIVPKVVKVVKEGNKTKEYIDISGKEFYELFGHPEDLTNVQKKQLDEYFKKYYKGKYVIWKCKVIDVYNNKLELALNDVPYTMSIIAYINPNQKEKLVNINKGDMITIEGRLEKKIPSAAVEFFGLRVWLYDCKIITK